MCLIPVLCECVFMCMHAHIVNLIFRITLNYKDFEQKTILFSKKMIQETLILEIQDNTIGTLFELT